MGFVERGRSTEHLMGSGDRNEGAGWMAVCDLDEIEPGRGVVRVVNGLDLALLRDGDGSPDDAVHALGNQCPHRGGQLGDGRVVDGKAICPLHTWDFDLRTGVSPFDPADSVPTFPARVVDGRVEVDASAVPLTAPRPPVYLGPWIRRGATDRGMYLVHHLAEGAGAFVEAMGSERNEPGHDTGRRYPSYDDLVFRPAQVAALPTLGDVPIDTATVLGTRSSRPLRLDLPVFVSHMSFGALSAEAKEALARGSAAAGTAIASGEGGAHPRERDNAAHYIFEMASGYFGWTDENIAAADAIEIKCGQGAKPGLGGTLLGAKVTDEIAAIRGVAPGTDVHSPAHFPDINSVADLTRRVAEIKSVNGGRPVGIKFAAGHVEADLGAALEAGADWITVDGLGGGTGAAPTHVKDNVGLPSITGLHRARRFLDAEGATDVQLIATGGFRTPDEMAKALALGADAVALATTSLMAIGCQQYRACHRGTCPVGIATQDPKLRDRLDVDTSAERLANFLVECTALMADFARVVGKTRLVDLDRSDLVSLDARLADRCDLEYAF
ncbi:MAG: nitrite reductase (NAD(P)H) small subunit [Acidimicrobiales bacterium]|nr:nitrite reductase (NAD(P)H) small subunit [Acidimicrobiales bacterium]MCB1014525.1 nitrite reductase (NAD(P)H) small subunit [Acidimicrobiales bacterium]MCB9374116.1 nitrite reductase (NAD(P)H) small subunit [Microthrixaceae bacterium]